MHQDRGAIRKIGRGLILAGVAVWIPYGVLLLAGRDPDVRWYLPFHLSGVIPGAILVRRHWLGRQLNRIRGTGKGR